MYKALRREPRVCLARLRVGLSLNQRPRPLSGPQSSFEPEMCCSPADKCALLPSPNQPTGAAAAVPPAKQRRPISETRASRMPSKMGLWPSAANNRSSVLATMLRHNSAALAVGTSQGIAQRIATAHRGSWLLWENLLARTKTARVYPDRGSRTTQSSCVELQRLAAPSAERWPHPHAFHNQTPDKASHM